MKIGIVDIETNGINDWACLSDLKEVHCLCVFDSDDQTVHRYNQQTTIKAGLNHLRKFDMLVAHNGINFDFPVLKKLYGFEHEVVRDTAIMSRCIYPDIRNKDFQRENFDKELIGSHSLKAWGKRIGKFKSNFGETTDWSVWSKEMEDYCVQDVYVTLELYHFLMNKNPNPIMMQLEHKFATLIREQQENGFPFNVRGAEELTKKLMIRQHTLLEELQKVFPPRIQQMKSRVWVNESNGVTFDSKKDALIAGYKNVVQGNYKTKEIPFNPNSRDQIAERLMEAGWKPKAYEGKRPTINESVLKDIDTEQSNKLLEYLTISKRLGQIAEGSQAWLKTVIKNRIHGSVNTNGTVSGRCSHNNPNIAQVPATRAPYGAECRELFTAPESKVLVGCDASGLELRCLAHYLSPWDKGEYGKKIVEDDIHSVNQKAAGLSSRDQAKTFIYAWLYGAGDLKIGSIVGGNSNDGRRLKDNFTKKIPAVKHLLQAVKQKVETTGVLKGLDGRELPARSAHSALNLLLQSAGAIVMKQALVEFSELASYPYEMHANVHDEVQFSCSPEHADALGKEFVCAIRLAGETLKFNCALDGEYHVGQSWKETH